MTTAYLEVSPMFENHWTGIPAVVAALARKALSDKTINWLFFYQSIVIESSFIAAMLEAGSGKGCYDRLNAVLWEKNDISDSETDCRAVFLNIKPRRRFFQEEAMFVHDLTPLLTPLFHNTDSVNYFSDRIREDIESSDHFFCNSKSTRDDLVQYFKLDQSRTTVVPLGVDISRVDISAAQAIRQNHDIEPYVVIIGTLEPRKNAKVVLDFLAREPGFAQRFRVVFVGRDGWLEERSRLLAEIARSGLSLDRIVFAGFVSESEKAALIQNASFCVYPSFYEGYGLPIAEAASLGKLVVCSNTSSMKEVAPDNSVFFDPFDPLDFWRAMRITEQRCQQIRRTETLIDVADGLAAFQWDTCYNAVASWAKRDA